MRDESGEVKDESGKWKDERKGLGGTSKKKWAIIIAVLVIGAVAALLGTLSGGGSDDTAAERERLAAIAEEQRIEAERLAAEQQRLEQERLAAEHKAAEQKRKEEERKRLEAVQTRGTINGHDYVDLGLSVKWATCNVGASTPRDYGDYYAWGETTTKSDYSSSTSTTYGNQMSSIAGNPIYDAARKKWGSPWRLPTKAEFQELIDNCTWEWITRNGHNGYKVTSKKNGNSIFLPAAGWRLGTLSCRQGSGGDYWSATPNESLADYACYLYFNEGRRHTSWDRRDYGYSVRPVCTAGDDSKRKADEERKRQEAASNSLSTRTFTVNGVSFKMVAVEGGTFTMDATSELQNPYDSEKTVHDVTLSDYCIGETEVTQALWEAVMGTSIYDQAKKGNYGTDLYGVGNYNPMYYINYDDCITFINKLNSLLSGQLPSGRKFRLPTEAEWEFAARGGNRSRGNKYSGSNSLGSVAWYGDNSNSQTHPVKQKQANELGLYDMSGNVLEWCYDWYGHYSSSSQTNPKGPSSGFYRVLRGGSWYDSARSCRVVLRGNGSPGRRSKNIGLRLAL